ncbi:CAP domain-containing protein [Sphingomonas quercus]|uniref:CAP domain-containing protein n=1 Tax=Sphingomonas quercus TaxID=2842451 RepID=UPI00209AD57D|nr:CAP domain-containing protein [Sphingomonas quercus]
MSFATSASTSGTLRNYVPGRFPDVSRTGDVIDVAHYTQIIWRATRAMGCTLVSGEADQFLTCRYAEGGNVIGERPY